MNQGIDAPVATARGWRVIRLPWPAKLRLPRILHKQNTRFSLFFKRLKAKKHNASDPTSIVKSGVKGAFRLKPSGD